MDKKKAKKLWGKKDIALLAIIFYLLGVLTPLFIYMALNDHQRSFAPLEAEEEEIIVQHNQRSKVDRQELWENTTILRSALYQYIRAKGYMPETLSELGNDYLPERQKQLVTSSKIFTTCTGGGGWVYKPSPIENDKNNNLKTTVKEALTPNTECPAIDLPFQPLRIHIIKSTNTLLLMSGDETIKEYPVGLGIEGKTPEGNFSITKKVMNPNGHVLQPDENPYGKRGLELSDPKYAIHGTNQPESIGKNASNGCIRMHNKDIIELYSIIPVHTPVTITNNPEDIINPKEPMIKKSNNDSNDKRERNIYFWAG